MCSKCADGGGYRYSRHGARSCRPTAATYENQTPSTASRTCLISASPRRPDRRITAGMDDLDDVDGIAAWDIDVDRLKGLDNVIRDDEHEANRTR